MPTHTQHMYVCVYAYYMYVCVSVYIHEYTFVKVKVP